MIDQDEGQKVMTRKDKVGQSQHFFQRERDHYSKNLSKLYISSYGDLTLFWDAEILRSLEIMTLFRL